jgi:hypothetical protein
MGNGEWGMGNGEWGNRKQETGNRKQETGNRKQETGNRKQETGKAFALPPPFASASQPPNGWSRGMTRHSAVEKPFNSEAGQSI